VSPLPTLLAAWLAAAGVMFGGWVWHLRSRNAGVVDAGWAASVGLVSVFFAAAGDGAPGRRWLAAGLVALWSVRLTAYLLRDRILGRPEDGRYAELRRRGSIAATGRFFYFFQAQGAIALALSLPMWVLSGNPAPLSPMEWAAALLWVLALAGEAAADRQLERFRARPGSHGEVCRDGLWRYSRHPNYFFEWLIWVAYAWLASASPSGAWAFAAPLAMLYLLFRVTGIPETEAQAIRTRGERYRAYQRSTSVFVPWWPKASA
jgi:steroid 5-alpha reductase family enzyme